MCAGYAVRLGSRWMPDQTRPRSPVVALPGQDLAECPFCGSTDIGFYEHVYAQDFSATCKSCGAEGPRRPSHEEARRLWNLRARQ